MGSEPRLGIRLRPFWLLTLTLVGVMAALIVAVLGTTRARATEYACLRFESDLPNVDILLDINTGQSMNDTRPVAIPQAQAVQEWSHSPDNQQVVYLRRERAAGYVEQYRLLLKPLYNNLVSYANDNDAVLIETRVKRLFGVMWSPDNQKIAYAWRDTQDKAYITLVNRDGEGKIQQQIVLRTVSQLALHGWSFDSQFVAVSTDEGIGRMITYWSVRESRLVGTQFPLFVVLPFIENVNWSPSAQRLAYLRTDKMGTLRLVVASMGTPTQPSSGGEITLSLPFSANNWIVWSPDGKHISMRYVDRDLNWKLAIFRIDDKRIVQVADLLQGNRVLLPQGSLWADDGLQIMYWRQRVPIRSESDLVAYDLGTQKITLLVSDVLMPGIASDPLNPLGGKRPTRIAVVSRGPNGVLSVDLMNPDGSNRLTIVKSARSIAGIFWSPDRSRLMVRWTSGQGLSLKAAISWLRADGSQLRVLEDRESETEGLTWMADGNSVLFVARQPGALSVEALNLETNARVVYAGGLNEVHDLSQDPRTGRIIFWWRLVDGSGGTDSYTAEGKRLYRYRTATGQVSNGTVFPSPEGDQAIIVAGDASGPNHRAIQLAYANGDSKALRTGVLDYTEPRWTPDGRRVALNYRDAGSGATIIEILDAAGGSLYQTPRFNKLVEGVIWTRCD